MCESKRAEFVDCGSRRPSDKAWCLATDLKCVKRGDCRPTPSAVWHVDRRLTVSRLLPGSGTLLLSCSFFTLKVSSSDVDGGRLGFWLSLSVQGRPRKLVSVGLSLLLRGTVALALKALLLLLLLLFSFRAERAQCCKSGRDVSLFSGCLSTTRPLSSALSWPVCQQCKQPSIPRARRGGASVKEWSDRVKYREIQQRKCAIFTQFWPLWKWIASSFVLFFVTVHLVASWLLWSDLDERLFCCFSCFVLLFQIRMMLPRKTS